MVIFNVYIIYIICLLYVFLFFMGLEIYCEFFFFGGGMFGVFWEESNCFLFKYLLFCLVGIISYRKVKVYKRKV